MDFSKYVNKVLWVDPERKLGAGAARASCSTSSAARPRSISLTFAPDPSTHNHCTLGGMIGNNSCGVHSLIGLGTGRTSDQVDELEVLLYDGTRMTVGATSDEELERIIAAGGRRGEIYARLQGPPRPLRRRDPRAVSPKIPRRVSGYNLDDLLPENGFHVARALVGTEGTCVTVLEAQLHLVPSPPCGRCWSSAIPTSTRPATTSTEILESGPIGLEGLDDILVEDMKIKGIHPHDVKLLPRGRRLAAGRVRRRDQGRVRRQGHGADGAAQGARQRARR